MANNGKKTKSADSPASGKVSDASSGGNSPVFLLGCVLVAVVGAVMYRQQGNIDSPSPSPTPSPSPARTARSEETVAKPEPVAAAHETETASENDPADWESDVDNDVPGSWCWTYARFSKYENPEKVYTEYLQKILIESDIMVDAAEDVHSAAGYVRKGDQGLFDAMNVGEDGKVMFGIDWLTLEDVVYCYATDIEPSCDENGEPASYYDEDEDEEDGEDGEDEFFEDVKKAETEADLAMKTSTASGDESYQEAYRKQAAAIKAEAAEEVADPDCMNKHPQCKQWANTGECTNNPGYMVLHCAKACNTCDQVDSKKRCAKDPSIPMTVHKGDINKMYERIVADPSYDTTVHSQPPEGPWVITIDDFVSEEQGKALLDTNEAHFKRSSDAGAKQKDGTFARVVSKSRTSENAWCNHKGCTSNELVQSLTTKIENLTGVPGANHEYFQVLKYEVGQYYVTHNDYIPDHQFMMCGPRVYTLFLYLNDVPEGGGTKFPKVGIEVTPKRGRAVLWPSVLDETPMLIDRRTVHSAEPVLKGQKFGANAWLHQYDFKGPNFKGCTG